MHTGSKLYEVKDEIPGLVRNMCSQLYTHLYTDSLPMHNSYRGWLGVYRKVDVALQHVCVYANFTMHSLYSLPAELGEHTTVPV